MGMSRWEPDSYRGYSASVSHLSAREIFRDETQGMDDRMDPLKIDFREARDSDNHPNSTPIIVGLDITGSMGRIAEYLAKTGLGVLVNQILQRRPVPDPTVCFMAIGDTNFDRAPLQVGQFESDIVMTEWLEAIYLEQGGGGNGFESYDLPYYFALYHTRTDSHEKRQQPGVIITIGDEEPCAGTSAADISKFIGTRPQVDIPFADLVDQVRDMYTPYHIIIAEGSHARRDVDGLKRRWREYLGNGAIVIRDHTKVAELVVSMLEVDAGRSIDEALSLWNDATKAVLRDSFSDFLDSGANRLSRMIDG